MKIDNWPRIFSCPTYSSSARGRSVRSTSTSTLPATLPPTRRLSSSFSIVIWPSSLCQQLQRLTDPIANGKPIGQLPDGGDGFLVAVAEREKRIQNVGRRRRCAVNADGRREIGGELVLQLQQQALGSLLADPGDLGKATGVLHRHGLRSSATESPESTDSAV